MRIYANNHGFFFCSMAIVENVLDNTLYFKSFVLFLL